MKNDTAMQSLKAYLFPTLVSIISAMIWYDVTEIKQDVKQLMAQSNIDKTRIDNLEKQLDRIPLSTSVLYSASNKQNLPSDSSKRIVYREFLHETVRKKTTPEDDARKKPYIHA